MKPAILVVAVLAAPILLGQEPKSSSRPATPEIRLPITEFATPFGWADAIVVTISSATDTSASPPSRELRKWRIDSGGETFAFDHAGITRLREYLLPLGKARPGKWSGRDISERVLLVRADADAPFAYVQKVMEAAAGAAVYKLSYAAEKTKGGGEQAFDWWLPRDLGPRSTEPLTAPRVALSWNSSSSKPERLFAETRIPATKEGDEQLMNLLRETQAGLPPGKDVRIFMYADPTVPWQALVGLMDLIRRAGVRRAAFGANADLPKLLAQESKPASRPAPAVNLPVTDQSTPFKEKDPIVATIGRAPGGRESASRPAVATEGWEIVVGDQAFPMTKAGMIRLQTLLSKLGKTKLDKHSASERALLINADFGAPYGLIQKLLEAAAGARIYRIWMGVASKPGEEALAFDTWLPKARDGDVQPGEIIDEIRVLMSWNTSANKLERLFGQRLVPPTPDGNRELERLIRESREENAKRGNADVPLIIDCGPKVPWQYVIDVLGMGRRAGVKKLEFGFGAELGK
jgi:biopolymer transport protein ExbD